MIDLYAPLKDLVSWYTKRNEIKEIEPFVLCGTSLVGLKQKGRLFAW